MSSLRLITYNVQRGIQLPAMLDLLSSSPTFLACDLLAVQEATPRPDQHLLHQVATTLSPEHRWEYRQVMRYPGKEYGNGFVYGPRCELVELEVIPLPRVKELSWLERKKTEGAKPDQKSALLGRFRIDGRVITIANVHLDFAGGWRHRRAQLTTVLEHLDTAGPTDAHVVCGDFNTTGPTWWPGTAASRRRAFSPLTTAGFQDASAEIRFTNDMFASIDPADPSATALRRGQALGITYRQKMDHVLVRGLSAVLLRDLGPSDAKMLQLSDHLPVGVDLSVPTPVA